MEKRALNQLVHPNIVRLHHTFQVLILLLEFGLTYLPEHRPPAPQLFQVLILLLEFGLTYLPEHRPPAPHLFQVLASIARMSFYY